MAAPFDNSVLNGLAQFSAIAQEQYYDKPLEYSFTSGKKTNMLFNLRKSGVTGDGETFQCKTGMGDSVRPGRDPYADFVPGRAFTEKNYKVRWNVNDLSAHDFSHVDTCVQIGLYDLRKAADSGNILSLVETVVGDNLKDLEHKMAVLRRVGVSARLGDVNGTPKTNDHNFIASCSAASGLTARVNVDNAASVWFRPNMFVDIYDSTGATLRWRKALVTHVNFSDTETNAGSVCSIGLENVTNVTEGAANFTALADNDRIYLSDTKDVGAISVETWMATPSSSSDTLFNRDRLSSSYQWMLPLTIPAVASGTVKVSRAHLNRAANARGFVNDDVDTAILACANPLIVDSFRSQFEEAAFVQWGSDDTRAKRFANFGMMGLNYQHPALGMIKILGDEFMKPNTLDLYTVGDWVRLHYGNAVGLSMLPGPFSGFNRLPASTAGAPLSKHFSQDGYLDFVDICEAPEKQIRISNLTW